MLCSPLMIRPLFFGSLWELAVDSYLLVVLAPYAFGSILGVLYMVCVMDGKEKVFSILVR